MCIIIWTLQTSDTHKKLKRVSHWSSVKFVCLSSIRQEDSVLNADKPLCSFFLFHTLSILVKFGVHIIDMVTSVTKFVLLLICWLQRECTWYNWNVSQVKLVGQQKKVTLSTYQFFFSFDFFFLITCSNDQFSTIFSFDIDGMHRTHPEVQCYCQYWW